MSSISEEAIVQELEAGVEGAVLAPGRQGYDEARAIHNGMIDKRPAVIVRARAAADVATAVAAARRAGLELLDDRVFIGTGHLDAPCGWLELARPFVRSRAT